MKAKVLGVYYFSLSAAWLFPDPLYLCQIQFPSVQAKGKSERTGRVVIPLCVGGGGVGHNNSGVGRGQKQFGKGGIGEGKIGGGEQENYWVVKISCTFLLPANIFCYYKTSVPKKDFSTHILPSAVLDPPLRGAKPGS